MSKKAAAPKGADPGSDDDDDDVNAKNNLLKVKVVKADDIIAADRGGTSDAYAIVDFSGLKRQTQVVKKSLTPSWDETFEFECGRPNGRLLIEVYDYDWIGAHDFLGLVEVDLGTLAIEALAEGWFDLMPRPGRSDVVAGRIYLSLIIVPKDRSEDDLSGLDAFPWLDRRLYKAKGHARQYNVIQVYFASTYADFQEEIKEIHTTVFPRMHELCQARGYTFNPVMMRYGMDERTDRLYMGDPRIANIVFREIQRCRRVSPRCNFFVLAGDRYGSSLLPASLDKNECMAIRAKLGEDEVNQEHVEALLLMQNWYQLDDNQAPSRFVLLPSAEGISPSAGPGTPQHGEWRRIEELLFNCLSKASDEVLAEFRAHKYKVSLFEQEVTLGALWPEDAGEHVGCIVRSMGNLRVVNIRAGVVVDLVQRRGDCVIDDIKEVRQTMLDEKRRDRLIDLKARLAGKLGSRIKYSSAQWQGMSMGRDHIEGLCEDMYQLLSSAARAEMRRYPRHSFLREEVALHRRAMRRACAMRVPPRNASSADAPIPLYPPLPAVGEGLPVPFEPKAGEDKALERIREYVLGRSDGSVPPLTVMGSEGGGLSSSLALAVDWCRTGLNEHAVVVYRQIGVTPDSNNGPLVVNTLAKQIRIAFATGREDKLRLSLTIAQARELPAADRGGTSDPFVAVKVGKHQAKTEMVKKTLNPVWDAEFSFDNLVFSDCVDVKVYDYDIIGKNDLLGIAQVNLGSLELNEVVDRWLPVLEAIPIILPDPEEVYLDLRVVAAKDLAPALRRVDINPYVVLYVDESERAKSDPSRPDPRKKIRGFEDEDDEEEEKVPVRVQTKERTSSMDPDYTADFEMVMGITYEASLPALRLQVWDKVPDADQEDILIGEVRVDTEILRLDFTKDDWWWLRPPQSDVNDKPSEKQAKEGYGLGAVHLIVTKRQRPIEGLEEKNEEDEIDGPRIRLQLRLEPMPLDDPDAPLDTAPPKVPCTYLELCGAFGDALTLASAARPIVIFLDGLERWSDGDPACTMRWLPAALPRYVYAILGFGKQNDRGGTTGGGALAVISNRTPAPLIVKVRPLDPDSCRQRLTDHLGGALPSKRTLTGDQRSSLCSSFTSRTPPATLRMVLEVAQELPSFAKASPLQDLGQSANEVMRIRIEYTLNGRFDEFRLKKAIACLAVMPDGLSEQELKAMIRGGAAGIDMPGMMWAELYIILAPLIEERVCDGEVLIRLRLDAFSEALLSSSAERASTAAEILDFFLDCTDFLQGGAINSRKLRVMPHLLKLCSTPDVLEEHLSDLHSVELKLCSNQLFDLLLQLPQAGPGQGGRLEDLLGFLQELSEILSHTPRLLLQSALNMPDHTGVRIEGVRLDKRRRRGHFFAMAESKSTHEGKQTPAEIIARRKRAAAAGKGDPDLQMLHPRAMAWKSARPWIQWLNKPQTKGQCKKIIQCHTGSTAGAHFIQGGGVLISGGGDRLVKAWSPLTGEELITVGQHENAVTALAISPERRIMATAGEDGGVVLWDLMSGVSRPNTRDGEEEEEPLEKVEEEADEDASEEDKEEGSEGGGRLNTAASFGGRYPVELRRFKAHSKRIIGLAFLSEHVLVSASDDRDVKTWEIETGVEMGTFTPFRFPVTAVAATPPARRKEALIATAGLKCVKFWRADSLDQRGVIYGHDKRVSDVRFSNQQGDLLCTASWDGTAKIWIQHSAREWHACSTLRGHTDALRAVAWSPDNSTLITTSTDRTLKVWQVSRGGGIWEDAAELPPTASLIATFVGHGAAPTRVEFHPGGSIIVSAARDGEVRVWDSRVPFAAAEPASHSQRVIALHVRNKDVTTASAGEDGAVKVWDAQSGVLQYRFDPEHGAAITAVVISNSGQHVVTASRDGSIKRFDVKGDKAVLGATAKAHRFGVAGMVCHHQGEFMLSYGSQDARITVWDIESLLDVVTFTLPAETVILQVAFSLDGKFVISADAGSSLRLWNIEAAKQVLERRIPTTEVHSLIDFSPDGKYIATVADGASDVALWDAQMGFKFQGNLTAHTQGIIATGFAADSRFMASVSLDLTMQLWVLHTRQPAGVFLFEHIPTRVSFSGRWPLVVAADEKGNVYFLSLVSPTPLTEEDDEEIAEHVASRPGTQASQQRMLTSQSQSRRNF